MPPGTESISGIQEEAELDDNLAPNDSLATEPTESQDVTPADEGSDSDKNEFVVRCLTNYINVHNEKVTNYKRDHYSISVGDELPSFEAVFHDLILRVIVHD
jgi:hypothetical protein